MELLMNLLPGVAVAYAETAVKSDFFGFLTTGANMFVSIIKWAALLFVLVKIAALGFKITTSSKNSSEALKTLKDEGLALFIGFFIVMTAFLIHGAMKSTITAINNNKTDATIEYNNKDVFKE